MWTVEKVLFSLICQLILINVNYTFAIVWRNCSLFWYSNRSSALGAQNIFKFNFLALFVVIIKTQGCILFHRFWKPTHARFEKAFKNRSLLSISLFFPIIPLFFVLFFVLFLFSVFPLNFSSFSSFFPFSLFYFPSFRPLWKASQFIFYTTLKTSLTTSIE